MIYLNKYCIILIINIKTYVMKYLYTLLLIFCFALPGKSQNTNYGTDMTAEQRQEIAEQVRTNFMEMIKLAENNTIENLHTTFKEYIDTSDAAWIEDPALALSMISLYPDKEAAFTAWAPKEGSRSGTVYKVEDEHIAVLSPESALYVFTGTFSIIEENGTISDEYPVSGTYVFVRTNDKWKIVHFHQSWEN